ncbi:response regulator [Gloeobacter kilaueensis]|uniref:Two component transcriptional regulator, LuxR family n=1 Tax=Gloeobacter kilaueensis (strain ATCC BAA-2537 / CCAP 1431/1 / ULC 316 / JS1) TaxID=1183438 RepID=U5QLA0_GLOK1|nr:response regulator transcription factor [Gloeobacter kilaueensis]AGY59663.1 two component transcriptional regulator, LuxR family [Gloeobacter kilaueensis JS1]
MGSREGPIRVLIADDHPVVRAGLAAMLEVRPEDQIAVVAQAGDGRSTVELFAEYRPDIALIDLRMPELDGIEVIAAIRERFADARLIVLTTYDGDEDIYRCLQAGAKAYLLKGAPRAVLVECIRTVHAGQSFVPSQVGSKLLDRLGQPQLSEREREVVQLMAQGMSNQQIGSALFIAETTVKFHVNNILTKLQAGDRTQAVIAALKRGIAHL